MSCRWDFEAFRRARLATVCVDRLGSVSGFAGDLSRPIVDSRTHKDEKYWANDAGFLWPVPFQLARYTGVWEYRIDHGVLRPKPLETVVCAFSIGVWATIGVRAF